MNPKKNVKHFRNSKVKLTFLTITGAAIKVQNLEKNGKNE